ncbi:MAG TPA: caspase family protein [Leptolyngbyaceae cyanobacterium]
MKRREFLGRITQAIAGLGLIDAGWLRSSDRYYQALAQPTGRKLALLVGINQYTSSQPLNGCVTDVELQRELLIHRFGFKAADILSLTEQRATREQIETAFLEHLTNQAQPGDAIVFHFSGYGRRAQKRAGEAGIAVEAGGAGEPNSSPVPSPQPQTPLFNSLVTVDGDDLLEETLWLLLRSLPTNRITTILDTSFNPPGKILPGNLQIRSFPQILLGQISEAELAFQTEIQQNILCKGGLNKLKCDQADYSFKPAPHPSGVVLVASGTHSATEAKWNGFSAGLFTYALTQYLWEVTTASTVQVSFSRVTSMVEQLVGKEQQPQLSGQKNQDFFNLTYYLCPDSIGADGVVKLVEEDGKTAQVWLAGILPTVLEYYEVGSKLALVPSQEMGSEGENLIQNPKSKIQNQIPSSRSLLHLRSRTGLVAKAQIIGENSTPLSVGQLVQEAVRVLPRNIRLTIALDPSLERIERVDATSAFATIPYVSLVAAGEQIADYVFGRVLETKPPETPTILSQSPPNRYGLFSLDRKVIPNTAGELGEAVKVVVQRLAPKLQTLLAAKIWRLTTNEGSSLLNVKASLEIIDRPEAVLMQRETLRSQQQEPKKIFSTPVQTGFSNTPASEQTKKSNAPFPTSSQSISIPIGSQIQYRVQNNSARPVYVLLLGLDSSKNAIALYSTHSDPTANDDNAKPILVDVVIAPGETAIMPQTTVNFEWVIHKPTGIAEQQLIFSTAKFSTTLAAMATAMQDSEDRQYIAALSNPLEVAQAMMQDLHNASVIGAHRAAPSVAAEAVTSTTDTYSLDVNQWASLSFVYQVTQSKRSNDEL